MCSTGKSLGQSVDIVSVAHPGDPFSGQASEEHTFGVVGGMCFAVLAGIRTGNMPTQCMSHEVNTVADSEHRYASLEERRVDLRGVFGIDTVWPTGKDNADRLFRKNFRKWGLVWQNLAVNRAFPHAARDQLVILPAKIKDDNRLMVHKHTLFSSIVRVNCTKILLLFCHKAQ